MLQDSEVGARLRHYSVVDNGVPLGDHYVTIPSRRLASGAKEDEDTTFLGREGLPRSVRYVGRDAVYSFTAGHADAELVVEVLPWAVGFVSMTRGAGGQGLKRRLHVMPDLPLKALSLSVEFGEDVAAGVMRNHTNTNRGIGPATPLVHVMMCNTLGISDIDSLEGGLTCPQPSALVEFRESIEGISMVGSVGKAPRPLASIVITIMVRQLTSAYVERGEWGYAPIASAVVPLGNALSPRGREVWWPLLFEPAFKELASLGGVRVSLEVPPRHPWGSLSLPVVDRPMEYIGRKRSGDLQRLREKMVSPYRNSHHMAHVHSDLVTLQPGWVGTGGLNTSGSIFFAAPLRMAPVPPDEFFEQVFRASLTILGIRELPDESPSPRDAIRIVYMMTVLIAGCCQYLDDAAVVGGRSITVERWSSPLLLGYGDCEDTVIAAVWFLQMLFSHPREHSNRMLQRVSSLISRHYVPACLPVLARAGRVDGGSSSSSLIGHVMCALVHRLAFEDGTIKGQTEGLKNDPLLDDFPLIVQIETTAPTWVQTSGRESSVPPPGVRGAASRIARRCVASNINAAAFDYHPIKCEYIGMGLTHRSNTVNENRVDFMAMTRSSGKHGAVPPHHKNNRVGRGDIIFAPSEDPYTSDELDLMEQLCEINGLPPTNLVLGPDHVTIGEVRAPWEGPPTTALLAIRDHPSMLGGRTTTVDAILSEATGEGFEIKGRMLIELVPGHRIHIVSVGSILDPSGGSAQGEVQR